VTGIIIGGLIFGSIYSLVALGVVLVFRTSGAFNLAQGSIGTVGAMVAVGFANGHLANLPPGLAAVLGIICGAVISVVVYLALIYPVQSRGGSLFGTMIATLGVALVLDGVLLLIFGPVSYSFHLFPHGELFNIHGVSISSAAVAIVGSATIVLVAFAWVLKSTRLGLRMRMGGSDSELAKLSGIAPVGLQVGIWAVAGALGALAVVLFGSYQFVGTTVSTSFLLASLVAASWGAFRSLPWTVIGAVVLGIVTNLVARYSTHTLTETATLGVLVFVYLALRKRVASSVGANVTVFSQRVLRSLYLRYKRTRYTELAVVLVVLIIAWLVSGQAYQQVLSTIAAYAIVLAGLTICVRYSGQLNLGAVGFMAVGSYVYAITADHAGVVPGLLLALVAGGVIGAAIGLITLRMNTVYYINLTLVFAAMVPELVALGGEATGGQTGRAIPQINNTTILQHNTQVLIMVLLAVAAFAVVAWYASSRWGVQQIAMSRQDSVARVSGIREKRGKVIGETIAGTLMSLGGVVYSVGGAYVSPNTFSISTSLLLAVGVLIAGGWSMHGLLVSAGILVLVPQLLGSSSSAPQVVFGAAVIIVALIAPDGVESWMWLLRRRRSKTAVTAAPTQKPLAPDSVA
jgi:sulfate-transporting ATPase